MFLQKDILKIWGKFAGEHQCWGVSSIKLQGSFIEVTHQHGFSLVNLLYIFRKTSTKNTSRWLLLLTDSNVMEKTISSTRTEIYMHAREETAISSVLQALKVWNKLLIAFIPYLKNFFHQINNLLQSHYFGGKNGKLTFPNTLLKWNKRKISMSVYRKHTLTDQ